MSDGYTQNKGLAVYGCLIREAAPSHSNLHKRRVWQRMDSKRHFMHNNAGKCMRCTLCGYTRNMPSKTKYETSQGVHDCHGTKRMEPCHHILLYQRNLSLVHSGVHVS